MHEEEMHMLELVLVYTVLVHVCQTVYMQIFHIHHIILLDRGLLCKICDVHSDEDSYCGLVTALCAMAGIFLFHCCVQTGCATHTASYLVGTKST
jgi:hypothetical protein